MPFERIHLTTLFMVVRIGDLRGSKRPWGAFVGGGSRTAPTRDRIVRCRRVARCASKTGGLVPWLLLALVLAACDVVPGSTPVLTVTPTPGSVQWRDAAAVMGGICFESANDAAGQVFVLRDATELNRFYDLADNSQLCRRPIQRAPFDFADGQVLAGLWSAGRGCTARHEIVGAGRDGTAGTITLRLRFITEGECNYELVRPFWVAVAAGPDEEVRIEVEAAVSTP